MPMPYKSYKKIHILRDASGTEPVHVLCVSRTSLVFLCCKVIFFFRLEAVDNFWAEIIQT